MYEAEGIVWRSYGTESDAPTVLILHGLFGSGDNWHRYGELLGASSHVLVPDLPNHGRSLHTTQYDYPTLSDQLWESLEHLRTDHFPAGNGTPVSILGHSMGGKVAMGMTLTRPEAVHALVVADISPREYPPRHMEIFEALQAVATAPPRRRSEAEAVMEPFIPDRAQRLFLLKSLVFDGAGGYRWQMNVEGLLEGYREIRGWPYLPGNPSVEHPVTVIAGAASPYVAAGDEELLRGFFATAVIHTIPDAGHWLHVEAREQFTRLLVSALTAV